MIKTDFTPDSAGGGGVMTLEASTVTSTRTLDVEVERGLPAGDVTRTLADRMALPEDVPWALRDDGSSVYLDPGRPIGDQVEPGARITVTPKTHLG
jgi:hypothetical protein